MKLLFISFHFEYTEEIEAILDRHDIQDFVRYPMLESKDIDGKHFGTQVFPGNSSVVQALVEEERLQDIKDELKAFHEAKDSHRHLQAFVLPIESNLLE
ncbi:MAG: hypothetical protein K9J81_10205 [Desulfohalobiaceae bacterium]|jgi:hypothetical protein|nr:hypothetical protein [Desulfohalobiaceae bacterium]